MQWFLLFVLIKSGTDAVPSYFVILKCLIHSWNFWI